ncbi:S41 family peptidase [Gloeobacter violaceus]|uniref:Gll1203 protein n=1 Tax=Gloeobacter violaceus (strain ATCC 29082 / PCC 7421) TaxID=251221 RepID=Q7NLC3_GLOVI|nr:S41 family peptidase [Gloeobacter violaceus]BAC89144.1 gll1203 [Gloeobacter violaceus PCC 7421]
MERLSFLALAAIAAGVIQVPAAMARPTAIERSAFNSRVRDAVVSRWRIPLVERTTTVDVTARWDLQAPMVLLVLLWWAAPGTGTRGLAAGRSALRDNGRAVLVGTPTYGKGAIQQDYTCPIAPG